MPDYVAPDSRSIFPHTPLTLSLAPYTVYGGRYRLQVVLFKKGKEWYSRSYRIEDRGVCLLKAAALRADGWTLRVMDMQLNETIF